MIQISKYKTQIIFAAFIVCCSFFVFLRNATSQCIMSYNVENLFDTRDDSLTIDEEFLPEGDRHWNNQKFYKKINNIYRVIISISGWEPPAVVGLCEIENRYVLEKLVYDTPLKQKDYAIIHKNSPDRRGIDVAMIYRPSVFIKDTAIYVPIRFPFDTNGRTRDILYVKGRMAGNDTLHIFVNHWPSRYGGYMVTVSKREWVASQLRHKVDSIMKIDENARIIIMGDFNDGPFENSIKGELGALTDTANLQGNPLINLMTILQQKDVQGTLKFHESWDLFDQIIVSKQLFSDKSGIHISEKGGQIYAPDFLLKPDERYLGQKPFRTYVGFSYEGGYSDHLPVFVELVQP